MQAIKVIFKDAKYNYTTSVNPQLTLEEIQQYFVGTEFNLGDNDESESMQRCVNIELIEGV